MDGRRFAVFCQLMTNEPPFAVFFSFSFFLRLFFFPPLRLRSYLLVLPVFLVFLFFMYPKKGLGRVRRFIGLVW